MTKTGIETSVLFRPARADDVPRMMELIAGAHMPAMFVEEHMGGFIAAERDGELVACGGIEMYEDSGLIRSVVVDETGRGLGLGGKLAELLIAKGLDAGAADLYLFTGDALQFWARFGFAEVTFEEWRDPARLSWQYQFLSQNRELVPDIHTMWRKA
jgi:amino-acid N-acetyltransferase